MRLAVYEEALLKVLVCVSVAASAVLLIIAFIQRDTL